MDLEFLPEQKGSGKSRGYPEAVSRLPLQTTNQVTLERIALSILAQFQRDRSERRSSDFSDRF